MPVAQKSRTSFQPRRGGMAEAIQMYLLPFMPLLRSWSAVRKLSLRTCRWSAALAEPKAL